MIYLKDGNDYFIYEDNKGNLHEVTNLIEHLQEYIEFDDKVTFEQFFNLIMLYHEEYSRVFSSHLGHYNLSDFADEWKQPYVAKESDIDYVEVYWDDMSLEDPDECNNGTVYNQKPSFHGWGTWYDGSKGGFGIEFCAINTLKDLALKINLNQDILDCRGLGDNFLKYPTEPTLTFKRAMTCYDVIAAILYEITFCGNPTSRNIISDELSASYLDIIKDIDISKTLDDNEIEIKKIIDK